MSAALMDKLTGGQTGGNPGDDMIVYQIGNPNNTLTIQEGDAIPQGYTVSSDGSADGSAGGRRRRHRKSHKSNSWLAHVKATMKLHPGKSFKQVLKIAKKTYKRSQSQSSSQSGGRKRNRQSQKNQKKYQNGGSGGKMAGLGESAAPYV